MEKFGKNEPKYSVLSKATRASGQVASPSPRVRRRGAVSGVGGYFVHVTEDRMIRERVRDHL